MNLKGDTYLVTGGAGFIGSHLVDELLDSGAKVRVLDNLSSGSLTNLSGAMQEIDFREGSILDENLLARAVRDVNGVFHLAAVVSIQESIAHPVSVHEVNSLGTLRVFNAAAREGVKVVFASSAAIYGDGPEQPKTEEIPPRPISPYGIQKLNGEQYMKCLAHLNGLEGLALRYFNVYGARQDVSSPYSGVISIFLERALRGLPIRIYGDGSHTRDYIYIDEVIKATIMAMKSDLADGSALNIGTGRSVSLNELADAVRSVTSSHSGTMREPTRPGDIRYLRAGVEKCDEAIGFRASVSLESGLSKTLVDFGAEGLASAS